LGQIVKYKSLYLNYEIYGEGKSILFAFHGFGQSNRIFKEFVNTHGSNYKIYAFDLFFHGKSYIEDFNPNIDYTTDFVNAIKLITEENKIEKFDVFGYSIGVRSALICLQNLHTIIDKVYIASPDGIINNFWFDFATKNVIGKKLFRYFLIRSSLLVSLIKLSRFIVKFNKQTLTYICKSVNTEGKIFNVYNIWMLYSFFNVDLFNLLNKINRNNDFLTILLAKNDQIINNPKIIKLLKIHNFNNYKILNTNHYEIISHIIHAS